MNDHELTQAAAIGTFVQGADQVSLTVSAEEHYAFIAKTLKRTDYFKLRKREKTVIMTYLRKMTGYSRQQLVRLISQYQKNRWIGKKGYKRNTFPRRYVNVR